MGIIWFLLIGLAAGWLAGQIMRGSSFGLVGNLIIGVIGAILGGYLFGMIRLFSGLIGDLVCATIGAVLLLFLLSFVQKRR